MPRALYLWNRYLHARQLTSRKKPSIDALPLSLDGNRLDAGDDTEAGERVQLDPAAFAALYERHLPGIYSYIRARTGSDEDAIDLAHQAFVNALEALPRYRDRGVPMRAWLYRIARNAVIDFQRRARSMVPWDSLPQIAQPFDEAQVETAVLQRERAERLRRLLGNLDEAKREVLILRFASGLKVREIAAILDRSEAAVKTEIRRSLRALRERYDDD
jgi:RNA polymerase sigma-70 factor (ECF subfamily)